MFTKLGQLKKKLAFCYLPSNREGVLGGQSAKLMYTEGKTQLMGK